MPGYGIVNTRYLSDVADAIRLKNGLSDTYKVSEMADAINEIPILKRSVLRPDAELVASYSYDKYLLADEGIEPKAYTTTSTNLITSQNLTPQVTCDFTNYNYYILIRMATIPEYSITTINKGREEYALNSAMYEITEIPENDIISFIDSTKKVTIASRTIVSAGNSAKEIYFSNATTLSINYSAAYGYNQTVTSPSFIGNYLTIKSPVFIVSGHTTYFTNTFMNAVTDVRYQYVIDVYRAKKGNLNLDGWGLGMQWLKMNEDIQTTNHKLT